MLNQSKTEGGSCVRMRRLVPFDDCSSLRQMQSKYALSSTRQVHMTTVNGTICWPSTRVPGGPGSGPLNSRATRWRVRVRPPDFGGYPFVASTRRVVPLHVTLILIILVKRENPTLKRIGRRDKARKLRCRSLETRTEHQQQQAAVATATAEAAAGRDTFFFF